MSTEMKKFQKQHLNSNDYKDIVDEANKIKKGGAIGAAVLAIAGFAWKQKDNVVKFLRAFVKL